MLHYVLGKTRNGHAEDSYFYCPFRNFSSFPFASVFRPFYRLEFQGSLKRWRSEMMLNRDSVVALSEKRETHNSVNFLAFSCLNIDGRKTTTNPTSQQAKRDKELSFPFSTSTFPLRDPRHLNFLSFFRQLFRYHAFKTSNLQQQKDDAFLALASLKQEGKEKIENAQWKLWKKRKAKRQENN